MAVTAPSAGRFYAQLFPIRVEQSVLRLARLMDDLDDVLGIVSAASSHLYVVIILLCIALVILATLALGPAGLFASLLASGAAIGVATTQISRR